MPKEEVQHFQLCLLPASCPNSNLVDSSESCHHFHRTQESAVNTEKIEKKSTLLHDLQLDRFISQFYHTKLCKTNKTSGLQYDKKAGNIQTFRKLTSLKSVPPSKQFFHVSPTLHTQMHNNARKCFSVCAFVCWCVQVPVKHSVCLIKSSIL